MQQPVIPDSLWDQIRNDFITSSPEINPKPLAQKWNVSWVAVKDRARQEHWRTLRAEWQKNRTLPSTVRPEPILTTNTTQPIVRDFFHHYYRRYLNVLPRLADDAERISDLLAKAGEPQDIHYLAQARDKILERTRVILGVMAPGQIKEIPKARRAKLPAPTPTPEGLLVEPPQVQDPLVEDEETRMLLAQPAQAP